MRHFTIAIDGPSGSGKSSLAKQIAQAMDCRYVDTGAMYRSVGWYIAQRGIDPTDEAAVGHAIADLKLEITYGDDGQREWIEGRDISDAIRSERMSLYASAVSKHAAVRAFLLDTQRNVARQYNVVMDGRDIGTVVLPDATVKIFMTASDEVRAKRRYLEQLAKGERVTFEQVLSDMRTRDENDRTRTLSPAVAASDAILFDNSALDREQTLARALEIIRERIPAHEGEES